MKFSKMICAVAVASLLMLQNIVPMVPVIADTVETGETQTTVETVVLLSKGIDISAGKLRVEMSVENMDLSAAHGKTSYGEIKKHVKDKTGLNVTSLNIAQVKRKYGMIERVNHNLPRTENPRRPNCTPQKEKAILDAFGNYGMNPQV